MKPIKFELSKEQQERFYAWFKHHWEVVHKGFSPRDSSAFKGHFMFGPTGLGNNVKYECAWCKEDSSCRSVDMTEDEDGDSGFLYQYDENWNRLKASWEK